MNRLSNRLKKLENKNSIGASYKDARKYVDGWIRMGVLEGYSDTEIEKVIDDFVSGKRKIKTVEEYIIEKHIKETEGANQ